MGRWVTLSSSQVHAWWATGLFCSPAETKSSLTTKLPGPRQLVSGQLLVSCIWPSLYIFTVDPLSLETHRPWGLPLRVSKYPRPLRTVAVVGGVPVRFSRGLAPENKSKWVRICWTLSLNAGAPYQNMQTGKQSPPEPLYWFLPRTVDWAVTWSPQPTSPPLYKPPLFLSKVTRHTLATVASLL